MQTETSEPQPKVLGLPQTGGTGSPGSLGQAAPAPASPSAEAAPAQVPEDKLVLGLGGSLPPLSGGTSFGAEFADEPRTRWKSRQQFVLVLMGYCIGVGNLWRFPYLCGRYGGGAFLIAYFVMLCTVAAPLFFYECVLGQKFQKGPAETIRKMAPGWIGIAYLPVAMTLFYLPYYQLIVAYSLHYFIVSFQSPLPWIDGTTPSEYLDNVVLNRVEGIGAPGGSAIHGQLLFEVIVVWIVTAACLIKGIHSAGKAAYVTVILPVVMIVFLFFFCVSLEGAGQGLAYYLTPRMEMLLRADVWGLAAGQIIFSLSPGTGTCISLASFHERDYKGLFKDCVFVAISNSAFSLFGGLVVFSVVGNLAVTQGKAVEDVAASGEGLAFIVFAQGLAQMGQGAAPSIFSALFFLTLFLLGLDSSFAVVETLQTYLNDWMLARNPGVKISVKGNALRLVLLSSTLLLIGLPYMTRAGYFLLEIADHWIATYSLTVGVLLEYIVLGYVYTPEQVLKDVEESTGVVLPVFFYYQIRYVAPSVLTLVILLLLVSETSSDWMAGYPGWAVFLFGILPTMISISTALWPAARFRLRRLLHGSTLTPEGLEAARQRAQGPGFQTFQDEMVDATGAAPLAMNRA